MKTELIVIDATVYSQLKADIDFIKQAVAKLSEGSRSSKNSDEWLTPLETQQLLGIGRTKYFQMKADGAFVFSQFGRKAKISRKSLETFLKNNII